MIPPFELPAATESWLRGLPKAELHVHLQGSATPTTVAALAARHPDAGVPEDVAEIEQMYAFTDFEAFLQVYLRVSRVVQTADDVAILVRGLAADLAAQGGVYAEVTVTPYLHGLAGTNPMQLRDVLDSTAVEAERDHGVHLRWVYDFPSLMLGGAAEATLMAATDHAPQRLVGYGVGGPEDGFDRRMFGRWFTRARDAGLHCVPHAGETTGPDQVWEAVLDLHAERIGHGIGCWSDPDLVGLLIERDITLEVCPSSNVATAAVKDLADHPLPAMVARGLSVTINSDDPPMFGTSLLEEYRRSHHVLGLDLPTLHGLARNAVRASFAPQDVRTDLLARLESYPLQA